MSTLLYLTNWRITGLLSRQEEILVDFSFLIVMTNIFVSYT